MKKIILSLALVVSLFSNSHTQTFTQITTDGWNMGIATCKPAVADIDNDGLLDLLIGEWAGRINHFEQDEIGATTFSFVTNNFSNIATDRYAAPAIVDLDHDGLLDLIIGVYDGYLLHYKQNAVGSTEFSMITDSFNGIQLSFNATPAFTDLNGDGLFDMLVGDGDGYIHHYVQDAADALFFSVVTDSFNHINNTRFVTQTVTDVDGDGLLDLFTNGQNRRIVHYTQEAANSFHFVETNSSFNNIKYAHAAPVFTDLDSDGHLDLLIGELKGAIKYYRQDSPNALDFSIISEDLCSTERTAVSLKAHPCVCDIDGDGLLDLIVGGFPSNSLSHFVQESAGSHKFNLMTHEFNDLIFSGSNLHPAVTDLNGNNLLDLVIGEESGILHYYEQSNVGSLEFTFVTDTLSGIQVSNYAAPQFTDFDGNGRLDLLIGQHNGTLTHYEQTRANSTDFTLIKESFNNINLFMMTTPTFSDLDNDGLIDLLVGKYSGTVHHFEQETAQSDSFTQITDKFLDFTGWYVCPYFADINGDGLDDLLIGDYDGGIHFYERDNEAAIEDGHISGGIVRNFQLYQNYPNPFNPATTIHYQLNKSAPVNISIYNMRGRKVALLKNQEQQPGSYFLNWDGRSDQGIALASGLYILKFQTGEYKQSIKLNLVK